MSEKKELGKISHVRFGFGGYQDVQFGLSITVECSGSGASTFDGFWGHERSSHAKWTEEDRIRGLGEATNRLRELLIQAKKQTVDQLRGVPVEVTWDGGMLKSFRVLTEVL